MKQIAIALIKAQSEMSDAKKNAKNPFLKNSYADLNAIREAVIPVLNENKIAVLQPMIEINGEMYIKTLLLHESGETIESLTKVVVSKQNDAQSQGSGITYARRYGLQSLLNVGAVDDDGHKASTPAKVATPTEWATTENLKNAKAKGFSFEDVKKKYKVRPEQEQEFLTL
jgi:hypothetical protein